VSTIVTGILAAEKLDEAAVSAICTLRSKALPPVQQVKVSTAAARVLVPMILLILL
jgi:hypothetical protein